MSRKEERGNKRPRTQIKDLPKTKKELSKDEQKKVKGGLVITFPEAHAKPKN